MSIILPQARWNYHIVIIIVIIINIIEGLSFSVSVSLKCKPYHSFYVVAAVVVIMKDAAVPVLISRQILLPTRSSVALSYYWLVGLIAGWFCQPGQLWLRGWSTPSQDSSAPLAPWLGPCQLIFHIFNTLKEVRHCEYFEHVRSSVFCPTRSSNRITWLCKLREFV